MRERAFAAALKQLSELPDEEYVGLLAGLAAKASSTGREEVILSQKDRARYGKQVVTQANERLGDGHLTLSVQTRPIRGGLILSDGDVEVNCTFETLVRLLRGEMDRTVVECSLAVRSDREAENLSKIRDTDYLDHLSPRAGDGEPPGDPGADGADGGGPQRRRGGEGAGRVRL